VALDVLDDLGGNVDDCIDALAVRVLAQERGRGHVQIDTLHTRLDGRLDVAHVAARVREDLGLEVEARDRLAVAHGLHARGRVDQLNVVDTDLVEHVGNVHAVLARELGRRKLLALAQSRIHNVKLGQAICRGSRRETRKAAAVAEEDVPKHVLLKKCEPSLERT